MIALIPARAGSKRIPGKNTKRLGGHPLIAYTIHAALESGVFTRVIVSSEDVDTLRIVGGYDVVPLRRPPAYATDNAADILWVRHALQAYSQRPEGFAILRPTAPFRTAETIQRAARQFLSADQTADSIRAVEPVTQHPGKMWTWEGAGYPIRPLQDGKRADGVPWHSCPTQTLPPVYVQNASLEMAYTANIEVYGTLHGRKVAPFFTTGFEGVNLDTERDWRDAEALLAQGLVTLPDPSPRASPLATGSSLL